MKINDLRTALNIMLPVNGKQILTPMIYGFPGVGKSSVIADLAAERGIQLVDLRLSQHDNTDFKFPVVGEHAVKWITADFLPVEGNPRFKGTKGILFLDEMNLASQDVLASVFQLIYDHKVGDNKLMEGWHIVAAGNLGYEDGNDGVVEFPTALRDRMVPFTVDQFNMDEWLEYVGKSGCSDLVIGYIKANPTKLYKESKWSNEKVFITPRRWEKLGLLLATIPQNEVLASLKYIGEGFLYGEVAEFMEYVQETLNSIEKVNVKDLFQNYDKYEKLIGEMSRDRVFQMNSRVSAYLVNEDFKVTEKLVLNFQKYIRTLSDDLRIAFLRELKKTSITTHGKDEAEKKPVSTLLKKLFEIDKETADKVAESIKVSLGFTTTK
jgi:hypothetical protein